MRPRPSRPALPLLAPLLLLALGVARLGLTQEPTRGIESIRTWLDSLAHDPNGLALPLESVHRGPQRVSPGQMIPGSIAAWHGDLDVGGTVLGHAVAIGGDVVIHPGAVVHGDALAVGGEVRNEGGTVDGEMRSISALAFQAPAGAARTPERVARRAISLSVGWYLVLAAIGLFVALFARRHLEMAAEWIREDFARAFLYGVLGQVALLPALIVSIIALAITIVGILLIPFAAVAFVLGAAGALALGFLAMSFATGEAVMRWRGAVSPYGPPPVLQLLLIGLSVYFVLWIAAGALAWAGVLGGILRLIIGVITWVAVTVGFGATIASRGGTRAPAPPSGPIPPPAEDYTWQTPTPVTGVAAARRPTPPPPSAPTSPATRGREP